MAGLSYLRHRFEQVAASICHGLYAQGIEPPTILQFILRVEAEKVGRALPSSQMRLVSDALLASDFAQT
jgi:hypothetical protein